MSVTVVLVILERMKDNAKIYYRNNKKRKQSREDFGYILL